MHPNHQVKRTVVVTTNRPGVHTPGAQQQVVTHVYHTPAAASPPPPNPAPVQYVTNYVYQQPPPPQPIQATLEWVPATPYSAPALSHRAVVAGREGYDSSPLWVIRAHHGGDLVPGKLAVKHHSAYIPYNGQEVSVHNFEVLCAPSYAVRWLPSSNGQVPMKAISAGNTSSGEPLYIGRANHLRSVTPGKVHPSHGSCYIPFGGAEVAHKAYEVLCRA